ncbi:MAG: HDOD domain-containing protein [Proteobacteria bacterium]|nr:HDOD domain-containing protein [Pseudomonadota bacterium]
MTTPPGFTEYFYYYLAKQPIFDRRGNTYGYELLFRSEADKEKAVFDDGDFATMRMATSGFIKAQESTDQSKRIFVNFTERLILEGAPRALPPSVTVVEVLEDTLPIPAVMAEIIRLKQDGYFIAIDDYTGHTDQEELLDLADIIKVDVLTRSFSEIEEIFHTIKAKKALKVAEKVENRKTYNFLLQLGFDFFQGYFFAKPENLSGKTLHSFQTSRMRILTALNDPDLDTEKIIETVKVDPAITYRLLRLLNSAAFGFSMKIDSIRHAVTLLGNNRMRYWLRMIVLSDLVAPGKPQELLLLALSRGRFFEELALAGKCPTIPHEKMFLFGMLSLIDVMLDMPFVKILDKLPISDSLKEGYTNADSPIAGYIHLAKAIELGDIEEFARFCTLLNLPKNSVAEASLKAGEWLLQVASALT